MANDKNRLGRGLGSLFGSTGTSATPSPAPVQRQTVENPTRQQVQHPSAVRQPAQEKVELSNEESNPEKNVTIQEIKPREVAPAAAVEAAPEATEAKTEEKEPEQPTDEIEISKIFPNPNQPRTNFKKDELEELASSIAKDGVLQPILVRTMPDGTYQIIMGERRYQACKLVGLEKIPARIRDVDDNEALELALIENIQREDLNPIEEAYGYRRIMDHKHLTQAELAQMLSKGRSTIANALRLLELPENAQQYLYEGKITAGHARAILSVPSKEDKEKLTKKIIDEKLSVREAESIARLYSNKPAAKEAGTRTATPKSFKAVAKSLRKHLNTNVRVKTVQGKNKIEIEFKDEEDLQRLFKEMTRAAEN